MTWLEFLLVQGTVTALLLFLMRRALAGSWARLARVIVLGFAVGFPLDYIAEDRVLWRFSRVSGLSFLGVPVENVAFIAVFVTDIILLHLTATRFVPWRSEQETVPEAPQEESSTR